MGRICFSKLTESAACAGPISRHTGNREAAVRNIFGTIRLLMNYSAVVRRAEVAGAAAQNDKNDGLRRSAIRLRGCERKHSAMVLTKEIANCITNHVMMIHRCVETAT